MNEPTTHTLEVPGAVLTYDVRNGEAGDEPVLLIIGSCALFVHQRLNVFV